MNLKCPMCGKAQVVPEDHGPRPFCSMRCKLADLNNWLNERYSIPVEEPAEGFVDDGTQD
ncbi:MAG TPA: DNA gyrase inhibitor YacG [Polyangiaceae bacterium]